MAKTSTTKKTRKETTVAKKKEKKEITQKSINEKDPKTYYIGAIGRRKTATAQVRIFPNDKEKNFLINGIKLQNYFPEFERQKIVLAPLKKTNFIDKFKIEVRVKGGGKKAQGEAIRLGIARALVKMDANLREVLRTQGYLTRDPRIKERKKFGLKKARKAPQWSKR